MSNAISANVSESLGWSAILGVREHIPEGSTFIFEGPQRSGKTLGMVIWSLDAWQNRRNVFSNIQLAFPHAPLEFTDIKLEDQSSKFWNGHINIDELNFYFDARRSMSGANVEFGAFLLQQKKQGCNLTGTTHDLYSLDVRLRNNYDYLITPRVYPEYPKPPQILTMEIENGPTQRSFYKKISLDCRPFLGLYDSFQTYDPFKSLEIAKQARKEKPKSRLNLMD